jgi:hypothetical protein
MALCGVFPASKVPLAEVTEDELVRNVDEEFLAALEHELEYQPVHYYGHFIHALEIIAYMHYDDMVGSIALRIYSHCVEEILHLQCERGGDLRRRLAGP